MTALALAVSLALTAAVLAQGSDLPLTADGDRSGNFHSDAMTVVERYTPISRDAIQYEATIEDPQVFTRPWTISMPLYRRLEENAQLLDFRCIEMVEETLYGHLRKEPLVSHWEGETMIVDITRKFEVSDESVYDRHLSGNPPE